MTTVFLLQNQHKLLLNKQREWTDARDPNALFRSPHKDEAINQKVEVNAKDHTQRIQLLACSVNERGCPVIPPEAMPEPLPPKAKEAQLELSQTDSDDDLDSGASDAQD